MKELQNILQEIEKLEQSGEPYAIATVVKVSGSTYRRQGARMLITESRNTVGTISGGCLESDVFEKAKHVIATGKPQLVEYDTTSEDDIFWGTGTGCGGTTHVLIDCPSVRGDVSNFKDISECFETHSPVAFATVFNFEGQGIGMTGKNLIYNNRDCRFEEIEDTQLREALLADASQVLSTGKTITKHYQFTDISAEVLIEYIAPPLPLVIFGGGQDVFPLLNLAKQLGWQVRIVDHRKGFANQDRFPAADFVMHWEGERLPPELKISSRSVCVLMTHNYLIDKKILQQILPSSALYIGFLGPKKRATQLIKEIRAEGMVLMDKQLEHLYAPVGLDIGVETAEDIALSIVSEIQAVINRRKGGSLRERKGPIHKR